MTELKTGFVIENCACNIGKHEDFQGAEGLVPILAHTFG